MSTKRRPARVGRPSTELWEAAVGPEGSPKTARRGITILGHRINLILAHKEWNQQDLANTMGITRQAVSDFLRVRRPAKRTVKRYADALGVPLETLWLAVESPMVAAKQTPLERLFE